MRVQNEKSDKKSARGNQKVKVKEIELVAGGGIFNDNDADLKHDMIDTSKAKKMVTALNYVK